MARFCSFGFDTCTCADCCSRRYHADLQRQRVADLEAERLAAIELAERQSQLRLPMAGLAHCADQPASLADISDASLFSLQPEPDQ